MTGVEEPDLDKRLRLRREVVGCEGEDFAGEHKA